MMPMSTRFSRILGVAVAGGLSRRTVLRGSAGALAGIASFAVLPAFGTPDRKQDPTVCKTAKDLSDTDKSLVVSNWPEYIDEEGENGEPSTLMDFESHYDLSVSYVADVNDNAEFFAKVVNQLGSCQSTKRDMFMLT